MDIFEDKRMYAPDDGEMRVLGDTQLLAQWRHKKSGPPYIKIGRKILYLGKDLNGWLQNRRVSTQDSKKIDAKNQANELREKQRAFETSKTTSTLARH